MMMASPKGKTGLDQDVQHLFRAIRKGKAHLTRFMLAASNNSLLNCWNVDGRTPLIESCYIKEEATRGHMVRLLKDAGADVNMTDTTGKTALIHACEHKCNDVVKILIQHANICPDVEDRDGNTALIHSAIAGNDVALEMIVKSFRRLGLNVDHYNKAGYTALHVATTNGYLPCAKVLAVKGKASLTLKIKVHEMTPLEWCLNEGYPKSEVEFLKPSAKFYRLAKLTTTMAKYRKKSTQDILPDSKITELTASAEPIEKPRSRVKGLLRKVKTSATNGADIDAVNDNCLFNYKTVDTTTNEMNYTLASLDISESRFFGKSIQRKVWDNLRQRSLSQPDQQEDCQEAAAAKTGLSHSRTHPITSRDLQIGATDHDNERSNSSERIIHERSLNLLDEYGECDTDDIDTFCSDTDFSFSTSVGINNGNTLSNCVDRISCGEKLTACNKSPEEDNEKLFSHGTEDTSCIPMTIRQCTSPANDQTGYSSRYWTPTSDTKETSNSTNTASTVFNLRSSRDPILPIEECEQDSRTACDDMHPLILTKKSLQPTLPIEHSEKYKTTLTETIDANGEQREHFQPSRLISSAGTICMPSTEHDNTDLGRHIQTMQGESTIKKITKKTNKSGSLTQTAQNLVSNVSTVDDVEKTHPTELSRIDGNNTSPRPEDIEYDDVLRSSLVSSQSSNPMPSCKLGRQIQAQIFLVNNSPTPISRATTSRELTHCETEIMYLETGNKKLQETWALETEAKLAQTISRAYSECVHESKVDRRLYNECASTQANLEYLDLRIPVNYSHLTHGVFQVSNDLTKTMRRRKWNHTTDYH